MEPSLGSSGGGVLTSAGGDTPVVANSRSSVLPGILAGAIYMSIAISPVILVTDPAVRVASLIMTGVIGVVGVLAAFRGRP